MTIIRTDSNVSFTISAVSRETVIFNQVENAASAEPHDGNGPDQLDRLMAKLAAKNPRFAKKLKTTGQAMSSLALDSNGRETLLSLRMKAGLTQAQFAEAIGQRQANVSLMESGARANPQCRTMRAICEALHCSMNELDAALMASESQYQQHACSPSPAELALQEQHKRRA